MEDEKDAVSITGRVLTIRQSGTKLAFIDLEGDSVKVQLMCIAQNY